MKKICACVVLFSLFSFIGCASLEYAQRLRSREEYNSEVSYVYGKFIKTYETGAQSWNMGFILQNLATGEKYGVDFVTDEKVYLISTVPGGYQIVEFIYKWGQRTVDRQDIRSENIIFEVRKGQAVYIGDWRGSVETGKIARLRIDSIEDNFEDTTAEFRNVYASFRNIQTESVFQ